MMVCLLEGQRSRCCAAQASNDSSSYTKISNCQRNVKHLNPRLIAHRLVKYIYGVPYPRLDCAHVLASCSEGLQSKWHLKLGMRRYAFTMGLI
jgi:hypothetical protein